MSHRTFVFADIAGFTALTEAHGDDEGADVAEAFNAEAEALVRAHALLPDDPVRVQGL